MSISLGCLTCARNPNWSAYFLNRSFKLTTIQKFNSIGKFGTEIVFDIKHESSFMVHLTKIVYFNIKKKNCTNSFPNYLLLFAVLVSNRQINTTKCMKCQNKWGKTVPRNERCKFGLSQNFGNTKVTGQTYYGCGRRRIEWSKCLVAK